MVKYRLSRALKSYVRAGLDRVVQERVDVGEQQQVLAARVELRCAVAVGAKLAPALGRTISAPYRPISTCFATSEPLSYRYVPGLAAVNV